ncbi:MAG: large conductance mechanosensitive channel protein MscL [Caldilineales bacterium]|nr:large conductance mechanosensitive channel protein MscL [Caldilineales bacterium]MCW5859638.1 large conductance mechanosensitive channel protein MscL [Caldilineales bacterium]
MFKGFKEFAFKGSLIDIAVGLIMAAAIGAVITSLVENVLMPIIGIFVGTPSFDDLTLTLNNSVIKYGSFLTAVVNFILIALVVYYFVVVPYQRFKKQEAAAPPPGPSTEEKLLTEIRDALRSR